MKSRTCGHSHLLIVVCASSSPHLLLSASLSSLPSSLPSSLRRPPSTSTRLEPHLLQRPPTPNSSLRHAGTNHSRVAGSPAASGWCTTRSGCIPRWIRICRIALPGENCPGQTGAHTRRQRGLYGRVQLRAGRPRGKAKLVGPFPVDFAFALPSRSPVFLV